MVAGLRSTLAAAGTDIEAETAKMRLILFSEPVSPGGDFECEVMLDKLDDSLDQALRDGFKGLWASGDMTWEFGPKRDFSKLLQYELGLEALFRERRELCGICQYHTDTLPHEAMQQSLLVHPAIFINETLVHTNPHYLKSAWPADLQTKHKLDQMIASLS